MQYWFISWAVAAIFDLRLRNVIFEFSSVEAGGTLENPRSFPPMYQACHTSLRIIDSIQGSSLQQVSEQCNSPALQIAQSVIQGCRHHSYVARGGPCWLFPLLSKEAIEAP